MRPITKIALSIVAILGILQALLVAAISWPLDPFATWLLASNQYLRWGLLGLTAVVLLTFIVMLLVALLRRSTTTHLTVKSDQGNLSLSRQAVANTVAKAVAREHPVKNVNVDVKMLKRKQAAKVFVEANSLNDRDLTQEAARIEATAKQKLTQTLGIATKSVQVTLHPATATSNNAAKVL